VPKIAIIGAGSISFGLTLINDILLRPGIGTPRFHLMDIDPERLRIAGIAAEKTIQVIGADATVETTLDQREAIRDANYVINCIQVGGAEATKLDFAIPAKYGLRQTIADTLGIGGIFRALRTYPALMELAENIATVGAPRCQLLNYTNPMAMNMLGLLNHHDIAAVGLCHSVQGSSQALANLAGVPIEDIRFRCGGINHMAFFTEFRTADRDLYPVIFDRVRRDPEGLGKRVRFEMMLRTGYFVTESSEHQSEYTPYFIHHGQQVVERYRLPLDELLRRDRATLAKWNTQRSEYADPRQLPARRPLSREYGSLIIEAMESNAPATIYGNVLNHGLIDNLPTAACVEVACQVDGNGVRPIHFGRLPTVLAGIVSSNVAVQLATVEAAETRQREAVYHAAMLDPHTAATLELDQIWQLCDELLQAHADILPAFAPALVGTGRAAASLRGTRAEVSVDPLALPPPDGGSWPVAVRARNLSPEPLVLAVALPGAGADTPALELKLGAGADVVALADAIPVRANDALQVLPVVTGGVETLVRPLIWTERPSFAPTPGAMLKLSVAPPGIPALEGELIVTDEALHFKIRVLDAEPRNYTESLATCSSVWFGFSGDRIAECVYLAAPDLETGEVLLESAGPRPQASRFSCARSQEGGYEMQAEFALADLDFATRGVVLFNVGAHLMAAQPGGASATSALFGWPEMQLQSYAALQLGVAK
jgi:alpha-galactosidase/6-phospho-beta-glucosidase family protein